MKTTTTHRRCVECSGEFIADPRVGDRQVTCGAEGCQRTRHAERCREWHASNAEARGAHYQDVVVPFRQQQPDYQRRWRWGRRLREIREQTGLLGGAILGRLQALVSGAEQLLARAAGTVQTGVLAGESLSRAVRAVRATIAALEQLEASTAELRALGL
ncbi:MAG TPA: hypothetical protein VI700_00835 [Thermoanaerobaculaceae bacterium]|nr:hypothetical protein [Thermoanaerobaculaceae bacterium]